MLRRWDERPLWTLALGLLIATCALSGPWACLAHCAYAAGPDHHATRHYPRHVIATHESPLPTESHTSHTPINAVVAMLAGKQAAGRADLGHRSTRVVSLDLYDESGTTAAHCPPGPALTALTIAVILPMSLLQLARAVAVRPWRGRPIYHSIAISPPWRPPRTSSRMSF